jgi:aldehyde:ferredoxin oxidoreductase
MHGFYNLALRIDVSQKSFEIEKIPDSVLKQTLGGKGLATHLLLKYNPAGVDPLGPDNHLVFATGPVTRTALWGSCRYGVYTKSPLTGRYVESYCGGTVAEPMAAAGADAVMIYGVSPEPVWLEIAENAVQFHSAGDLWGLDTDRTEDRIKSWLKTNRPAADPAGVVTIGSPDENRAAFAVVENDCWRSAGRAGVSAVMGSKNIKAIACWGRRRKEVADPAALKRFAVDLSRTARDNPGAKPYKALDPPLLVGPNRIEGKAGIFTEWEDRLTLFDTLIICRFYRDLYQWEQLAAIIAAATGMELGVAQMRAIAARVADDTRRFNLREGLTSADDRLPVHFSTEPRPESGSAFAGHEMELMLKEYYAARGWDAEGKPESL